MRNKMSWLGTFAAVGLFVMTTGCDTHEPGEPTPGAPAPQIGPDDPTMTQDPADTPRSELPDQDRDFVIGAYAGGLYEVQSSEMALERTDVPEVQQFAQRMIQDHGRINQQLQSLAQQKGVMLPAELDEEHQEKMVELQNHQGVTFAVVYVRQQLQAHQDAVEKYQRQAEEGEDPQLRDFAREHLPALQEHLTHVQRLHEAAPQDPQEVGALR